MRLAAVNSLLFAMDSFYGLKEYKNIELFKDYINADTMRLLWSDRAEENIQGYQQLVYKQLDDAHTRLDTFPCYAEFAGSLNLTGGIVGDARAKRQNLYQTLSQQRAQLLGDAAQVRFCEDVAIITLDSFEVGSRAELYDSDGNLKDTAWRDDSYYYMRHCMKQIGQHPEVRTVVLDLPLNGGGYIGAMHRVLGFLSDKVFKESQYNYLTGEFRVSSFKIDTDGDGYYDDDAGDQYQWVVLTSEYTFSAANLFVSMVKEQKLATVIGQRTGGGMCSVMPLVLADGTAITISSPNSYRYVETDARGHRTFYAIEGGLSPDVEISYSEYYTDAQLKKYLESIN